MFMFMFMMYFENWRGSVILWRATDEYRGCVASGAMVMSWRCCGDGIVPCEEHIKGGGVAAEWAHTWRFVRLGYMHTASLGRRVNWWNTHYVRDGLRNGLLYYCLTKVSAYFTLWCNAKMQYLQILHFGIARQYSPGEIIGDESVMWLKTYLTLGEASS